MVEEKVELRYWLSMLFELALAARPGREISREIRPVIGPSPISRQTWPRTQPRDVDN